MHRLLIVVPAVAAAVAFAIPSERARPLLLPVAGAAHLALTLALVAGREPLDPESWLGLDALGGLILTVISSLFFLCALYAPSYLRSRPDRSNRILTLCLLVFLGMASLVVLSQRLGLLWVAVEGTTLSTAPLIYFNRNARSIEATWKYLMVGSVGIALALLGSLFLAYSAHLGHGSGSLLFQALLHGGFSRPWLRAGFVLLLVGYGTKMGLAPLHTWKPDAYGEAPGMVGALFAGGMTSCAFLALLRVYRIVDVAGEGPFARGLLVPMGLLSMVWAAVFLARQDDIKRMLAYSSVEQMGILIVGVGLGGAAVNGALFHTLNNALAKGVLFLCAANIHRAYGSKSTTVVSGALRRLPWSAGLFVFGFFAVTGSPPFGPFFSEFAILNGAVDQGRYGVVAVFLIAMLAVFIGMGATLRAVLAGPAPDEPLTVRYRDSLPRLLPIALSLGLVLLLGLWVPAPLQHLLRDAAAGLEGNP